MKMLRATLFGVTALALAACNQTATEDDAADGAGTTAVVPGPVVTETAVVPGATSTVAVPVPGATVTTRPDRDRDTVTINRDGVEVDVGNRDTRVKAEIDP